MLPCSPRVCAHVRALAAAHFSCSLQQLTDSRWPRRDHLSPQVPLINMAIVRNAGFGRLAPEGDTVYQLLLLVESAVPAAVTLLVVCGRVYPDSSPLSGILFWQYCASLVTLPAFLVWFLDMLGL